MSMVNSFAKKYCENLKEVCARLSGNRAKMLLKYAFLGAVLFGMAAHAFAYFNFAPIHDALNYIDRLAGGWEVSLGRFFQPIYGRIRGEYMVPWMSGMLSMIYIGLASFLVGDLFEVDNPWYAFCLRVFCLQMRP